MASRTSTYPLPPTTSFQHLSHLEDCIRATESCSSALSSGLTRLQPGVADLPRLTKILSNKHVCPSSLPYHHFFACSRLTRVAAALPRPPPPNHTSPQISTIHLPSPTDRPTHHQSRILRRSRARPSQTTRRTAEHPPVRPITAPS